MKNTLLPGTKVEIRRLGEKKSYGFISQIEEYIDENTLILGAPISAGKIIRLKKNVEYLLIVYSNKGIYRCKILLKKQFQKDNVALVKIEIITSLVKIQRREFFRFECVIPFKFCINDVWKDGIIKDISGGGIRFITNYELAVPSSIILEVPLTEQKMTLSGQLLLKEESNVELYKYQYRVLFKDIKKSEQDYIIQYIFSQQRKQVRQEKGL